MTGGEGLHGLPLVLSGYGVRRAGMREAFAACTDFGTTAIATLTAGARGRRGWAMRLTRAVPRR